MADAAATPAISNKPEKPDEAQYKADLSAAEKAHAIVQAKFNEIRAKLDSARPNNKDSPVAEKQKALRAELAEIRQKQSGNKNSRASQQERLSQLDAQLKSKIAEQKNARGKIPYKNIEEIDREISRLEKQVESGTMKIVDEKKTLNQVTELRKLKKAFGGFEDAQKSIDKTKADISELKKAMDNPEAKALSDRYNTIQNELNEIKSDQDDVYKNLNSLRDEREKLYKEQQAKYTAIREVKDNYFKSRRAYKEYEDKVYQARRERQKAERDAFEKEKRRKNASAKLEEASQPAFMDEILTAEGLIRYFDPSTAEKSSESGPSKFAATAQRTIETAEIKGMKALKKDNDEEDYFVGTGGKKGKKGRKGAANGSPAPAEGKFQLNIGVLDELNKVGVEPPMNQTDVPAVVEKLKAKLAHWKENQESQTKINVEKAQREIDRLEKEALEAPKSDDKTNPPRRRDGAKKVAADNQGVNGVTSAPSASGPSAEAELAQENDAAADVAEELKAAKIEDATTA